jgi:glycosyltransferase involved in cell wall biosynthesis
MGGVETHCEQLIPRLQRQRPQDQFTVIGRKAYCPQRVLEYDGVRVIALTHAATKRLEAISNALVGLLYARFRVGADVVHIQAIGPALVAPLAKAFGMKVVMTYHAPDYKRDCFNSFAKLVLRVGEFCALHFADQVIVVSPSLVEHLKTHYRSRSSRISFIPNGASHMLRPSAAEGERRSLLEKFGLEPGRFVVTVGRLAREKRFEDIIRAFRVVNSLSKLVVVGNAAPGDPYAEFLRSEADDRVVLTGFLSHAEITILLREASLFVLASRHEGLPIAALEAAILGCPVLLSDIQPNLDLGFGSVHYFKVGDVDDLRRKLAEPHSIFRADPDVILKRYDWDRISELTSAVYSTLAVEPRRSRQSPHLAALRLRR